MSDQYKNMTLEQLLHLKASYQKQYNYLLNPGKLDMAICLGGLLFLMGGAGAILKTGINIFNLVILIIGALGSYKWHKMDKERDYLSIEIDLINEALKSKQ